MTEFRNSVYEFVKTIPEGETRTYKQVAQAIDSENSSRAVGIALRSNTDMSVPCHRVIKSSGKLGQYNGLQGKTKIELLTEERS
jgi:methylated-DNA-[protein]-cysteine S-methyltransferase